MRLPHFFFNRPDLPLTLVAAGRYPPATAVSPRAWLQETTTRAEKSAKTVQSEKNG